WLSASEKPASPVDTPQTIVPWPFTLSRVGPARAGPARKAAAAAAAANTIRGRMIGLPLLVLAKGPPDGGRPAFRTHSTGSEAAATQRFLHRRPRSSGERRPALPSALVSCCRSRASPRKSQGMKTRSKKQATLLAHAGRDPARQHGIVNP